ncbi:hypothetical protein CCAX7_58840 [Capsulimonas corticalis]|uniref:Uncharacterized protein n=1 Tax=Capsulimonas corticalis TaxID=2219043 RepID=A0A402D008_9BACT|nr:hypothetical protein [Capsulimonas corticalis]BDI33833.1 hypothetical protein CCAX7_58840 [Capsulimonas corticalis]
MREPQNEMMGALLDIYYELRETQIRPIIIGGLGIYLRARDVFEREVTTLTPLAPARATQDIDMVLRPETILRPELRSSFQHMLATLKFRVIKTRAYWQYKRLHYYHEQKLDLHTWAPTEESQSSYQIVNEKLISLDPNAMLDAHIANEAIGANEFATAIRCSGYRSEGAFYECAAFVAHPFTLAVMKLLAYRDFAHKTATAELSAEEARTNLQFVQKHALDIYILLSTITEEEWEHAKELAAHYSNISIFHNAKTVVREAFSELDAPGMVQMRTSLDATPEMQFEAAPSLLNELFGVR